MTAVRQKSVLLGGALLAVIVAVGVLAPLLGTRDPAQIDPVARNKRPGTAITVRCTIGPSAWKRRCREPPQGWEERRHLLDGHG